LGLLENYKHDVDLNKMFFPRNWDKDELWVGIEKKFEI
jgi:hypothetical protein